MPLSIAKEGMLYTIQKIGGKEDVKRFLKNLGLILGTQVVVLSKVDGNMVINMKDSRIAIGKTMANKIIVV